MGERGESSGVAKDQVDDLLGCLTLHEGDADDFIWDDEISESPKKAKWQAIAKVHTSRGFSLVHSLRTCGRHGTRLRM